MSENHYSTKLSLIEAIPIDETVSPNMPVDIYLQEAEDLLVWIQDDKEALEKAGLKWKDYVKDMPVRIGALRYAQSIWNKDRNTQEEARQNWKIESPAAYELRNDLLADMRFAYRKREDLLNRVSAISEGHGHANMIQDLSDIAALGKTNFAELAAINITEEKLDLAATKSDSMADLLALANGEKAESSKSRVIRDQAFTHLKEAVNEIRETGRYIFRKNETRLKGYRSNYFRTHN